MTYQISMTRFSKWPDGVLTTLQNVGCYEILTVGQMVVEKIRKWFVPSFCRGHIGDTVNSPVTYNMTCSAGRSVQPIC